MKNKLIKLITVSTIFAFGIGLAVNNTKAAIRVDAAQHQDNYDLYYYSGNYYNSLATAGTDGLQGTFRKALSTLIFPKGWYIYGGGGSDHLSGVLQSADEDPTNSSNMVYLYTRDSVQKTAATVNGTIIWNREHVWPQSLSNDNWGTDEAGTDILHLRPTYEDTNSTRGNKIYGYVSSNKTTQTYKGMTYGYTGGNYFEPLDSVKGDVARIVMYVWTAYNDHYSGGLNIRNTFASFDTLLKWHILDKPDALEGNRNNYCETSKQKNRNPFVDHPEYAWRIFGDSASDTVKQQCMEAYPAEGYVGTNKTVTNISISGEANKKEYYEGESFDPAGLSVIANYDDGTKQNIDVNHCAWEPNPLTYGTSSVVCRYSGQTAEYSGITVNKRQASGTEYKVQFEAAPSDGSSELKTTESILSVCSNNTLIQSVTTATKVFAGKNGLKLGSSSAAGEIAFSLVEEARTNIERIIVETAKYSNDSNNITIKADGIVLGATNPNDTFEKTFSDGSINDLSISTSQKRAYLISITVILRQDEPVEPPTSSEYIGQSSSEISSSISEESSSSIEETSSFFDNSSETSEDQSSESSIEEINSSDEQESSLPPEESITSSESKDISYSNDIISSQINESSDVGVSANTSSISSSEEIEITSTEEKESSGCGGSLIGTMSLMSLSALVGLVLVFSKRK